MRRDNRSAYIRETERTARRLGLPSHGPAADSAIVDYCRRQVSLLTAEHRLPSTVGELLERVAGCLDVEFVEIHSAEDLTNLFDRIPLQVEPALVRVSTEFDNETDAITIRRLSPQPWERRYLSVINCQGRHFSRRFFTKWHELAHRLIDGEQLALAFRQTPVERKEPGEILVDKVAGELAFFPDIVSSPAHVMLNDLGVTFEAVEELRQSVAMEASRQATALALIRYAGCPAWYLRCAVSMKPTESRTASRLNGRAKPVPKLRVMEVSPNAEAIRLGIRIHQWMRVPESSLVSLAHGSGLDQIGTEQLEEWETSTGGPVGYGRLLVDAQALGDEVYALACFPSD